MKYEEHMPDCSYVSGRDESAARNIVLLQIRTLYPENDAEVA